MKVKIKIKPRSYYDKVSYLTINANSPEAAIREIDPNAEGIKEWKPGVFVGEGVIMGRSHGVDNAQFVAWEVK